MVENYKKFLWLSAVFLIILNIIYLFTFHTLIKKDKLINSSYKQFLLENRASPRLIIESGSNAKYGIDSKIISQALNISTINISDNAAVSLRYKLLRLEQYARAGDTVLLPLEWQYYSRDGLTSIFTDTIFRPHHHYYKRLMPIERVQLAYQIPFSSLVKRVQYLFSHKGEENTPSVEFIRLKEFMQRYEDGDRGGVQQQYQKTAKKLDNYDIENCSEYIFLTQIEQGFVISDTFKKNIKLIKRLQEKGVNVLVTWASVTGEDCYGGVYKKEIEKFSEELRAFLTHNGIPIIGDIYDSEFSDEHMYNTFYHLLHQAKVVRTQRLIKEINLSPYALWFDRDNRITSDSFESLYLKVEKNLNSYFIDNQNNENNQHKSKIMFLSGWYKAESWGRWSKGTHSSMLLFISKDKRGKEIKIKIKSRVYGKKSRVKISVNGKKIALLDLEGEHIITLPSTLLSTQKNMFELGFDYINVQSPSEVEPNSRDGRKIKLGVELVTLVE